MTRFIIALIVIILIAWALQPAHGAPSSPQRATITPRPVVTSVPTWTPNPAYPAPAERRRSATATPASGLQCRSC